MLHVKGLNIPSMNDNQKRLFELFTQEQTESEATYEPVRVDQVTLVDENRIRIHTSRFISIEPRFSSGLHNHLQIMEVFESYDADDPYSDIVSVAYREVALTNVFRTAEGDPGWVDRIEANGVTHRPDISSLHTDYL